MDEKTKHQIKKIKILAKEIRKDVLKMSYEMRTAHLASSLSCVDIISTIYESFLKIKNNYLQNIKRNRFILSKGHAATTLYSVLFRKKIISKKEFNSFCKPNSLLEEHPSPKTKGVECATGSLGHGLPIACGIALGNKIKKNKKKTYVLISDGECNEGTTWEAAMFASAKQLNNLILIVDYNKWQATGRSNEILSLAPLAKKFETFGWKIFEINGHNYHQLINTLKYSSKKKPIAIIANTIKGKGVSFMEDDNNWHYKSPDEQELISSLKFL